LTARKTNAAHTVSLSSRSGIHIKDGDNRLELIVTDAEGKEVSRTVRNIHFSTTPDHIEFVPQQSRLVADGKTRPIIRGALARQGRGAGPSRHHR